MTKQQEVNDIFAKRLGINYWYILQKIINIRMIRTC
jgi:hypothetical protein